MLHEIARIAGSGALGAASEHVARSYLLMRFNPSTGLAFGVIGRLVTEVTQRMFKEIFGVLNYKSHQQLLDATRFVVYAQLTAKACSLVGMPMTFSAALTLQIGQLVFSRLASTVCDLASHISDSNTYRSTLEYVKNMLVPAFVVKGD